MDWYKSLIFQLKEFPWSEITVIIGAIWVFVKSIWDRYDKRKESKFASLVQTRNVEIRNYVDALADVLIVIKNIGHLYNKSGDVDFIKNNAGSLESSLLVASNTLTKRYLILQIFIDENDQEVLEQLYDELQKLLNYFIEATISSHINGCLGMKESLERHDGFINNIDKITNNIDEIVCDVNKIFRRYNGAKYNKWF